MGTYKDQTLYLDGTVVMRKKTTLTYSAHTYFPCSFKFESTLQKATPQRAIIMKLWQQKQSFDCITKAEHLQQNFTIYTTLNP